MTLDPKYGKIVCSTIGRVVNGVQFSDIVDVWLFMYDGPVSLETATTNEVAQIAWLDKEQIEILFDKGKFVDTLRYFFEEKELGEKNYMRKTETVELTVLHLIEDKNKILL